MGSPWLRGHRHQTEYKDVGSNLWSSDGSGLNFFDPGRVGSIFSNSGWVGWVSHQCFGLGFGKFPLKNSISSIFFPLGQKKSLQVGSKSTLVKGMSASYLPQVKSMLGSGPISSLVMPAIFLILLLRIFSGHS